MKKREVMFPILMPLAALLPAISMASTSCPIERAHYTYTNGYGVADFAVLKGARNWISNLALQVAVKDQDSNPKANQGIRVFWFLFDQGSARFVELRPFVDGSRLHKRSLESGSNDESSLLDDGPNYYSWGNNMEISGVAPRSGSPAPEFIFLPELPNILWYSLPPEKRIGIGPGFFKFDHCAAKPMIKVVDAK